LIPDVKRHMEKTRLCVRCLCITSHRWLQRCRCRCMGVLETRKDACAVRVPGAAVPRDRRSVPSDPSHQIYPSVNVVPGLAKSPTPRSRPLWLCFAARRLGLRAPCRARVLYCEIKRKANPMCLRSIASKLAKHPQSTGPRAMMIDHHSPHPSL